MCVGAMDGRCQIDIASVVPAHIVFYILHQRLPVSLMSVILINHQILQGIIKTGFGCQIKTFAEGNGARQLVFIIKNAHQMIVGVILHFFQDADHILDVRGPVILQLTVETVQVGVVFGGNLVNFHCLKSF